LFEGLVIDESGGFVDTAYVGDGAFYVVDDDGFRRHVESEHVDRQVLRALMEAIEGHEELISEGTMRMLGQEDIFTKAAIDTSLRSLDTQIEQLLAHGLPSDFRDLLGMTGFRIVIDIHGDVLEIEQPGLAYEQGEE
jgi:hypothetical protein